MGCNLGRCNNLIFLENTDLHVGAANSTSKNMGLRKFWQDLETLNQSVFDKSRSLIFAWFVFTLFRVSKLFIKESWGWIFNY